MLTYAIKWRNNWNDIEFLLALYLPIFAHANAVNSVQSALSLSPEGVALKICTERES